MARIFKSTYTTKENGVRVQRECEKWYGEFTDLRGKARRVALTTDRELSQRTLFALVDAIAKVASKAQVKPDEIPPLVRKTFYLVPDQA